MRFHHVLLAATLGTSLNAVASAAPLASSDFEIALHASLLQAALELEPQSVMTPISRYAAGVFTSGTAVTNASVVAQPWPQNGGLGVALEMSSYTNAYTFSQTQPRPTILVDFNAAVDTWATTWKYLYLAEDGFHTFGAQTQAQTAITLLNLETSAWGLFWRAKERIAYEQAYAQIMAQKAQQELETSLEVSAQLNAQIDARTDAMLAPLNRRFLETFRDQFLVPGGYLGATRFVTEDDRFLIAAGGSGSSIGTFPELSVEAPIAMRIGRRAVERLARELLSGKTLRGDEVFALIAPGADAADGGPDAAARQAQIAAARAVNLTFAAGESLGLTIREDTIVVTLMLDVLETPERSLRDFDASFTIGIDREGDATIIDFDRGLSIRTRGGAIDHEDRSFAVTALRQVFPPVAVDVTAMELATSFLPIRIKSIQLAEESFDVMLAKAPPKERPATDTDAGGSDASASWCVAAGGSWHPGDDQGLGLCDCRAMWYRADAIAFYGEAEFKAKCRADLGAAVGL